MSICDLGVDTDLIRAMATAVSEAVGVLGPVSTLQTPPSVPDHVAGSSATARELGRGWCTDLHRTMIAVGLLGMAADGVATGLRRSADLFDGVEVLCDQGVPG